MLVIGAGPIGMEFAYIYNAFGTKVTVVEMMPHVLPFADKDITDVLAKSFKKQGITTLTNTRVESVDTSSSPVKMTVSSGDETQTLEADVALMAIGVQPNSENIGLEEVGIGTEQGFIEIDEFGKTSVDNIYSIGDVTGGLMLAHKASAEGIAAVETMKDITRKPVNHGIIPACTYCNPQVANIGITEETAKEQGRNIKVGKFPFLANGKSLALNESDGLVKLIFDTEMGQLIGAHMVGAEVTELINELALACSLEATDADIHNTIHAHPTISETIMEAAADAFGHAIHI
jgi:dihydrolipoamide dehydrogenase